MEREEGNRGGMERGWGKRTGKGQKGTQEGREEVIRLDNMGKVAVEEMMIGLQMEW
mgnify:CR=1 FL=1